jgi:hypothetical protein
MNLGVMYEDGQSVSQSYKAASGYGLATNLVINNLH